MIIYYKNKILYYKTFNNKIINRNRIGLNIINKIKLNQKMRLYNNIK